MKFAESELKQITAETWKILLGEELQHLSGPLLPSQMDNPLAACAQIVGDWQLGVIIYCPMALARHAAATMLGIDQEQVSTADVHDVLRELINIVAGNVKGLLSGANLLSLPKIVKGSDFQPRFVRQVELGEACFTSQSMPLLVRLLGEDRPAPAKTTPGIVQRGQ